MVVQNWRSRLQYCNLNQLIVLDALLSERHVTRAARRLGVSQPAVSRALKDLRQVLKDPIMVNGPGGYTLTPRAREIEPALYAWLQGAADIVGRKATEPSDFDEEIRIATLDDCQVLFLGPIQRAIAKEAPNLRLRFVSQWGHEFEYLDSGQVDFVIDIIPDAGIRYPTERLSVCDWVCVMRADHDAAELPLTLERYLSLDHALVSTTDEGPGVADMALPKDYGPRRIALRTPFFAPIPDVIEDTDLVTTLPIQLARKLFHLRRVVFRPLPMKIDYGSYSLLWHERSRRNAVHRWVIETVVDACQAVDIPKHECER